MLGQIRSNRSIAIDLQSFVAALFWGVSPALLVTCKWNGGMRGAVRRSVSLSIARQRQATRTAVVGSTRVSTASLFVRVKLAVVVTWSVGPEMAINTWRCIASFCPS